MAGEAFKGFLSIFGGGGGNKTPYQSITGSSSTYSFNPFVPIGAFNPGGAYTNTVPNVVAPATNPNVKTTKKRKHGGGVADTSTDPSVDPVRTTVGVPRPKTKVEQPITLYNDGNALTSTDPLQPDVPVSQPDVPKTPGLADEVPDVPGVFNPAAMEAIRKAKEAQRSLNARRRGRRSTILTGGQGLTEQANIFRKSLLGF